MILAAIATMRPTVFNSNRLMEIVIQNRKRHILKDIIDILVTKNTTDRLIIIWKDKN